MVIVVVTIKALLVVPKAHTLMLVQNSVLKFNKFGISLFYGSTFLSTQLHVPHMPCL